jgi:hypothetical protein
LAIRPSFGDRASEPAGAPAALQDAQQLGGADGAGGQRAGDTQGVLPLLADQLAVDAVAGEAVERAVVGVAIDAPEALVGQASRAGAELVAQQPEQPEDLIGVGGLVGDDHRRPALAGRGQFEQPIEDHQRVAQCAGNDDRVQAGELVGEVVQPGDPAAAGEVARVRTGVDRADRHAEAHPVDGGDVPVA